MRYCPHCDNELSETFAYILADPNDPRGPRMEVPVIACHGCEYIEEEQGSVSCLLCRETLRLKSSATVELLLWQHQIWMHDVDLYPERFGSEWKRYQARKAGT